MNTVVKHYFYWKEKESFLFSSDSDQDWVLYIIEKGTCEFTIDNYQGRAQTNDVIICPPNTLFYRKITSPMSFHFFRFELTATLPLEIPYHIDDSLFRQNEQLLAISSIIRKNQFDNSEAMHYLRSHLLSSIFFSYYFNFIFDKTQTNDTSDELINAAITYLNNISDEALSIEDIAHKLNINFSHFSRKFKLMMEMTPLEYRNRIRIRTAQKLLTETTQSINEIAETCGYSDQFYFSRIFKQKTTQSPTEYRNTFFM